MEFVKFANRLLECREHLHVSCGHLFKVQLVDSFNQFALVGSSLGNVANRFVKSADITGKSLVEPVEVLLKPAHPFAGILSRNDRHEFGLEPGVERVLAFFKTLFAFLGHERNGRGKANATKRGGHG